MSVHRSKSFRKRFATENGSDGFTLALTRPLSTKNPQTLLAMTTRIDGHRRPAYEDTAQSP